MAANEEIIDQLVSKDALDDLEGLNKKLSSSYMEMEKLLAKVQELNKEFSKSGMNWSDFSKAAEKAEKTLKDVTNVQKEQGNILKEIKKITDDVIYSQKEQEKASESQEQATKKLQLTTEQLLNVSKQVANGIDISDYIKENANGMKDYSAAINVLNQQMGQISGLQAELNERFNQGSLSEEEYNNAMSGLTQKQSEYQEMLSSLQKKYDEVGEAQRQIFDISGEAFGSLSPEIQKMTISLVEENKALNDIRDAQKELDKQYKDGKISLDDYTQKKAELNTIEKEQSQSVKNLSKELQLNKEIADTAKGSYANLSAQYSLLKIQINALSEAEGEDTEVKRELEKQANALYQQMIKLQEATGKYQLSVGDYAKGHRDLGRIISLINPQLGIYVQKVQSISDVTKLWAGANKYLADMLNISLTASKALLMSGIGLLIIGITSVIYLYKQWRDEQNKLNEVQQKFIQPVTESVVQVKLLFDRLKNATEGTKEYANAKKQIIDKYGEFLEGQGKEIANLEDQEAAYKRVTKAVIENARAKGLESAYEESTKKFTKSWSDALKGVDQLFIKQFGKEEGLKKFRDFSEGLLESGGVITDELKKIYDEFNTEVYKSIGRGANYSDTINLLSKNIEKASSSYNNFSKETEYANAIFGKLTEKIEENNGALAIQEKKLKDLKLEYGDKEKLDEKELTEYNKKEKAIKDEISRLNNLGITSKEVRNTMSKESERLARQEAERIKILGESATFIYRTSAETNKRIVDDDKKTFEERRTALRYYTDDSIAVIELLQQSEIASVDKKEEEKLITEETAVAQRKLINDKALYEIYKLELKRSDETKKLVDDETKAYIAQIKERMSEREIEINDAMQKELILASKVYNELMKKNIDNEEKRKQITKDYQSQRLEIIRQYNQQLFEEEVADLSKLLDSTELSEKEKYDIRQKINALTLKNNKESADYEVEITKEKIDKMSNLEEKFNKFMNDNRTKTLMTMWSMAFDIANSYYDNELKKIDELAQKEKDYYDERTKMIDDSVQSGLISEEYANERKKVIEAEQLEKEKQIDEKRKEMQRKQAVWQKANAIVQATISGAQAVVTALGAGPVVGIILAALVGALVAVQIAKIASQQIPSYREGTRGHPGGLALVGDGGRSEMAILPSGEIWKTPDRDTLAYLPKGTEVLPDYREALVNILPVRPDKLNKINENQYIYVYDNRQRELLEQNNSQLSQMNYGIRALRANSQYAMQVERRKRIFSQW